MLMMKQQLDDMQAQLQQADQMKSFVTQMLKDGLLTEDENGQISYNGPGGSSLA